MVAFSDYLNFTRRNFRFLCFGLIMAFTSSAGQTYFIGIFGPEIKETFNLSHTQWGSVYLIGTLSSAFLLPWSGQLIDRIDLRIFTVAVVTGLILACMTINVASNFIVLTFAIFLLRHFGQGLSSHTSITSMARYMDKNRGKAIAIASTGYSVGEAILPFLAVMAIAAFGWRNTYMLTAISGIGLLLILLFLLKGHNKRHRLFLDSLDGVNSSIKENIVSKTRGEMLKELRFYFLLPAFLAPSYIGTALFFHHLTLAEAKNWSGLWVTGNYWVYAVTTVLTALASGPLIDKYSAARVIPCYLLPLIIGLLILIPAQNPLWVMPYMVMLGVNTGIFFTGTSALWAELYGPKYLGGIKSIVGAISVFASALGPVTIGVMLDQGYTFDHVCLAFSAISLAATFLLIKGLGMFTSLPN